jgi:phosphoglycerate dehydrogenase-like enzyme
MLRSGFLNVISPCGNNMKIAIIDDWQGIARDCADWSRLPAHAQLQFHRDPLGDEAATARALAECEIVVPMRERTQLTASLLRQLPQLRLLALTGWGMRHVDTNYCNAHGIVCCGSGTYSPATTAELTLGLMLAAARQIARGDAAIRDGQFQESIPPGFTLEGCTLGILGVGRIGTRVAAYGRALGMNVIGWSRSMDDAKANAAGVRAVSKEELLRTADVLSIHVTFSESARNLLGAAELAQMKPGALLVNTARGPIVNEAALLAALQSGRLTAALDVFDQEPLAPDHPLRTAPNTVLTPHLGFGTRRTFEAFYGESVENILAFLQRAPTRVMNVEALPNVRWLS